MAGGDGMDTKADGKNLIKKKDDKAADKKDGDVEDADLVRALPLPAPAQRITTFVP